MSIKGIGPSSAMHLKSNGFTTIKDIAEASIEQLQNVPGFGAVRAALIIEEAMRMLKEQAPPSLPEISKEKKKKKKKDKKKGGKKKKKKEAAPANSSKKEKKKKKSSGKKKKKKK